MPWKDHASGAMSREAKRLDIVTRHGTLPHAILKVFGISPASFLSSQFLFVELLGLDIEDLCSL